MHTVECALKMSECIACGAPGRWEEEGDPLRVFCSQLCQIGGQYDYGVPEEQIEKMRGMPLVDLIEFVYNLHENDVRYAMVFNDETFILSYLFHHGNKVMKSVLNWFRIGDLRKKDWLQTVVTYTNDSAVIDELFIILSSEPTLSKFFVQLAKKHVPPQDVISLAIIANNNEAIAAYFVYNGITPEEFELDELIKQAKGNQNIVTLLTFWKNKKYPPAPLPKRQKGVFVEEPEKPMITGRIIVDRNLLFNVNYTPAYEDTKVWSRKDAAYQEAVKNPRPLEFVIYVASLGDDTHTAAIVTNSPPYLVDAYMQEDKDKWVTVEIRQEVRAMPSPDPKIRKTIPRETMLKFTDKEFQEMRVDLTRQLPRFLKIVFNLEIK